MKILLSSIAKNDIRLLMRVFNAEHEKKGINFLEDLKRSIGEIMLHTGTHRLKELTVKPMGAFPVNIHYIFEDEEHLLVTAVFKA
ncbi:hypothetical protein SD427_15445 [Chryseobacterium sp. JJR-5R]|uniref:hypothetical protein n=1 Tax=Chryseobacterium sp. JJR-5R TaxID=3093923 RepID=UPI002A754FAD|nr:hypothetical protein [Chryseobacterium sp. JJR-5R]WPO82150.1 hypothetical protein SD427_15445 [Chryseobacterium sp. JJR-5R]